MARLAILTGIMLVLALHCEAYNVPVGVKGDRYSEGGRDYGIQTLPAKLGAGGHGIQTLPAKLGAGGHGIQTLPAQLGGNSYNVRPLPRPHSIQSVRPAVQPYPARPLSVQVRPLPRPGSSGYGNQLSLPGYNGGNKGGRYRRQAFEDEEYDEYEDDLYDDSY